MLVKGAERERDIERLCVCVYLKTAEGASQTPLVVSSLQIMHFAGKWMFGRIVEDVIGLAG